MLGTAPVIASASGRRVMFGQSPDRQHLSTSVHPSLEALHRPRTRPRRDPPPRPLSPLCSRISRRSRRGGTSGERRSAVLEPRSYAESSLVSVVSQRVRVALRVSSMARLTADQTVRIDARRNQDHVLNRPRHHPITGSEGRHHSNLGVGHSTNNHAGSFSGHRQHPREIGHTFSHRRIIAQPAEQIVGHQSTSHQHMRPGQHLSGCDPNQRSQIRQFRVEPDGTWQPSVTIARQFS